MWLGSCGRNLIMSACKLILLRKSLKNVMISLLCRGGGQNYIYYFNPILRLNNNLACCYMKAWDSQLTSGALAALPPHGKTSDNRTPLLSEYFSNSYIIHELKTKKITTAKELWIPGLNKQRFWGFYFSVYSLVFVSTEKIYQTLETVFHRLSKHVEFR